MGKPREKKRKRERIRERERWEGGKREQGERERMLEREADKVLGCILCDFIEPVSAAFPGAAEQYSKRGTSPKRALLWKKGGGGGNCPIRINEKA